jgi:hypothetical protein
MDNARKPPSLKKVNCEIKEVIEQIKAVLETGEEQEDLSERQRAQAEAALKTLTAAEQLFTCIQDQSVYDPPPNGKRLKSE